MLDAGPLANLVHPRIDPRFADGFESAVAAGLKIVISEIADYEVRRKLLHKEFRQSVVRLDDAQVPHPRCHEWNPSFLQGGAGVLVDAEGGGIGGAAGALGGPAR
jgi:hypothetical protein